MPIPAGLLTGINLFTTSLSFMSPLQRTILYTGNNAKQNNLIDIGTLAQITASGILPRTLYDGYVKALGYSKSLGEYLLENNRQILPIADLITLYRRDLLSRDLLEKYALRLGIQKDNLQHYLDVTEYFPSPPDLIRFAIREVYTPKTRQYFGMDDDLPEEFLSEAMKAGLNPEQAKNYWAAHWELPSPGQGFEMLQRDVINNDELDMLLKSLDIMPFWRDKLTSIAYNPLTRVDVRRMYAMGVLTPEEVIKAYRHEGYSPENAQLLGEFTFKYENQEVNGITRSNIISAYLDDLLTKEELRQYLYLLGYVESVVNFWIDDADYKKTQAKIKLYKDELVNQYRLGLIDESSIKQQLLSMDLPSVYVDKVIDEAIKTKSQWSKLPSKDDLLQWLSEGLIDDEYFFTRMLLIGYSENDISLYASMYQIKQDTTQRRYLANTIYLRWYSKGLISEEFLIETLKGMKYNDNDIRIMLSETREKMNAD